MHVDLHENYRGNREAEAAAELIGACVHCGFCLETCPTYLDARDERDSPRGRIYLIRQLLQEGEATTLTRTHLDRCLTCRSCETTCPSGMRYGRLLDLGRGLVEKQAPREPLHGFARLLLRKLLTRPRLFTALLGCGQGVRPLLPRSLRRKVPPRQQVGTLPPTRHARVMLALDGCVQRAATPATTAAAKRVLDRLGISLISVREAGCCGAVNYHLGAHADGLEDMRRNIDGWWPHIEAGAEAIVSSASGCGASLVEYGELLGDDPDYAQKAQRVSAMARDISEVLLAEDLRALEAADESPRRVAVHIPCTLQHALQLGGAVPQILRRAGYTLCETRDEHLCCGSAGTYSLLQPQISERLRERKLNALNAGDPDLIATANVGCQLQLQQDVGAPVLHWIELLDR